MYMSLASRPGRKEWSFQRSYARQTRQQTCEQTCEQRLKQKVRQIDIHCVNLFVHWTALMFKCQSDADCVRIIDASARSNAAPLGNLAGAARARGKSSPFRTGNAARGAWRQPFQRRLSHNARERSSGEAGAAPRGGSGPFYMGGFSESARGRSGPIYMKRG